MIIKIWDLTNFSCNHSVLAHNDKIVLVRFIPNFDGFVSVSNDKLIKIWEQKPRKNYYFFTDKFLHLKIVLKEYHNIGWASSLISLSKCGDRMAVAGPKTTITIFNDFNE
jgi:WD40 repeat protein